jgi:hypothetical protein
MYVCIYVCIFSHTYICLYTLHISYIYKDSLIVNKLTEQIEYKSLEIR